MSPHECRPVLRCWLSRSFGLRVACRFSLRHVEWWPCRARQLESLYFSELTRRLFAGHVSLESATHAESRVALGLLRRHRREERSAEQLQSGGRTGPGGLAGTAATVRSRLE